MAYATVTMPDGRSWTPRFVHSINDQKCIGCGRCFKVCGRAVLVLKAVTDDGELIALDGEDEDDEYEKKIMTIDNPMNCIGCEACAKVCPKKCYTHAPMSIESA
jgi:Nif-specific ferredoxin III